MHVESCVQRVGRASVAIATMALVVNMLGAAGSMPARAANSGLQFDEVTKFVGKDSNPQPGTFAADFQAAVAASQEQAAAANNAQQHKGLFGAIKTAMQAAKSVGSILKSGSASTEYYLGTWHRTDDPGAQTATINKPDQHQIIYLNLAKKTYRIVDTGGASMPEMPPAGTMQNPQGPPPSPQPGTCKVDVTVSNTVLGPKTLENVATTGYSMSFKSTVSNSTGSCRDGSLQTSMTEYLSSYQDPAESTVGRPAHASAASHPEVAGLAIGCKPKISTHKSGGAAAPSGRLSMWTLLALGGNVSMQAGQLAGGFQTLIERGNVHTLGAGDSKLFEIPAGFTKETPSPPPAP